ncbi:hypothetical protein I204_08273 [Kwoniella mangroviensis CBS 8886]|nr:uncharacterized protein I203_08384 [Kwoniella mangroviensis CBS 8507]OCF62530.1 hypothetical protein I203_08384 [Kwoniella mangroviensis CBS 8507]OCF71037.1 hypothetical protein I204_08273 [Kwoniella mangroviensis CBS 8886]
MISAREEVLMVPSSLNIIRSSEPYDPYTPQSLGTKGALRQDSDSLEPLNGSSPLNKGVDPRRARLDAIHAEVDATKNILHKNIEGMVERGERLDHLQDRTAGIIGGAVGGSK